MRIHLIATGGTIAGHKDGWLTAEDFKSQLDIELSTEDLFIVPSSHMTPNMQFELAVRINTLLAGDVDGVVVTHGTDSLEESAFMVDLLLKYDKPVVFTGAMRSPNQSSPDGLQNLSNALPIGSIVINTRIRCFDYPQRHHPCCPRTPQNPQQCAECF